LRGFGKIVAGSTGDTHAHVLTELPDSVPAIREIIGRCKRDACVAVHDALPGSIWSAAGEFKPVFDVRHFERAHAYITEKQEEDAATFDCLEGDVRAGRWDPGRRLRLRFRREDAFERLEG